MKKKEDHILYYASLIGILALGIFVIYSFPNNQMIQMLTLVGMAISYAAAGTIHHLVNHDLVIKIVVEYVLIAILGVAIALFILRGGFGI